MPKNLQYTIRLQYYLWQKFLPLQDVVARSFNEIICSQSKCENDHFPEVTLRQMPTPPSLEFVVLLLVALIPASLLYAFLFVAINTVRYIAIEKEKQLKEAMNIMGLPSWINWTAWFIRSMIFLIIAISIIVIMLKVIFKILFLLFNNCSKKILV